MSSITKMLNFIADNEYVAKSKSIPEQIDNYDEIISEIQDILDDDGHLPDSMRYFELNGKTSKSEIEDYHEKCFSEFKIEFLAGYNESNIDFVNELLKQLEKSANDIAQTIYETSQIDDLILNEMIKVKLSFCDKTKDFLLTKIGNSEKSTLDKQDKERCSFKWLKGDDKLLEFFNKMQFNEIITKNTSIDDFKSIFSNIPVSQIKNPVQWEKGAKLFAYFFNKLISEKYIPQRPSWIILEYCFTYNRNDLGEYVPIQHNIKSNVQEIKMYGDPKDSELIKILFS